MTISRRAALQRFTAGLGPAYLPLTRAQAQVSPDLVRFRPEIEPLVQILERTPRERAAEAVAEQLRRGVSYRQMMAALFLAGVRNVNPRPPGFALHCVFVIHSAHLIGLEAPPESRLLPLFYALDNFKAAQERDARAATGDFVMREMRGALPPPARAAAQFTEAMDAWDIEQAERAVVSLARHRGAAEILEMLWRYGARDYRNIGHKAIYVANAARTLHAIGWQHAEPVLRSLVLSLLDFGREQQVNGYGFDNQCYAGNLKRQREAFPKLDDGWVAEGADAAATRSLLGVLREASPEEACADVAARLVKRQTAAGAVWDAVHLSSAELRMRLGRGGAIVGLHAVTSANALRHAWLAAAAPQTRFLMLLQAAGWIAQFRRWAEMRDNGLRKFSIAEMEPAAAGSTVEDTLSGIPSDLDGAASRVLRLAREQPGRQEFFTASLRSTIAKADEVHYYKYAAALVEDIPLVNAEWQPHLAAAMVWYMKGAKDPESGVIKRAREALKA
jgi:hypothetical protein